MARRDYEQVDRDSFVCFIENTSRSKNLVRALFYKQCKIFKFACFDDNEGGLTAEIHHPFETKIKMKIQAHPMKSCLVIMESKPISKVQSLGSSLLSSFVGCQSKSICKYWYDCSTHWEDGLTSVHSKFFYSVLDSFRTERINHFPTDTSPVVLGAVCLPIDTTHQSLLSFNETQMYYTDIPQDFQNQIIIQIRSAKRVQFNLKYGQPISPWNCDIFRMSEKSNDSSFLIEYVLNNKSNPILHSGRWFYQVKSSSVLSKTDVIVSIFSVAYPIPETFILKVNETEEITEEDTWIIVNDESSPAGRNQKSQVIGSFVNSNLSISIPFHHEERNEYSFNPYESECKIPEEFICPISKQIMINPAIAADGYTYESSVIQQWLLNNNKSPLTGEILQSKIVLPNFNLKSQIEDYNHNKL